MTERHWELTGKQLKSNWEATGNELESNIRHWKLSESLPRKGTVNQLKATCKSIGKQLGSNRR